MTEIKTEYRFCELSEDVKKTLISRYLVNNIEIFEEDYEQYLLEQFPNSKLQIQTSWLCCQGDGANIYGTIDFADFIKLWEATEKEKRTMLFYISKSICEYEFTGNRRYSYSCKFIDAKQTDCLAEEFADDLTCYGYRAVNRDLIHQFYTDLFSYFEDMDYRLYKDLYEWIYEPDLELISDYYDANGYLFTEIGEII